MCYLLITFDNCQQDNEDAINKIRDLSFVLGLEPWPKLKKMERVKAEVCNNSVAIHHIANTVRKVDGVINVETIDKLDGIEIG